jgi:PAS domain S-box-containing protein
VAYVISTGLDVTEQRRTERLFADVLAAATEQAIIGTDPQGVITVFNAGAERMLGYSAAELVGVAPAEILRERADVAAQASPPTALFAPASGQSETQEWTYVRKDGGHVPVAVSMSEMRDESGEVIGYLAVARDVTRERQGADALLVAYERERAAADRLREVERVRGDLIATVSHELRTPLTSILGNVEMLVDGDAGVLSHPQARLLARVERNARRLLALIEDLLILSRIEAGAVKVNARPVPVRELVGGALEALRSVRAPSDVELRVDMPDEPLAVYGDQGQLERVLINLVDNALKFTAPGGLVTVRVNADGGHARVTVADTGIGIPEGELVQVFDRFYRSTTSRERASPGSGLGLTITKSIVERHGGRISAESTPGTGTVVTCLLPRPPGEGRPERAPV